MRPSTLLCSLLVTLVMVKVFATDPTVVDACRNLPVYLMWGASGTGKSAFCNYIHGSIIAKEGGGLDSETPQATLHAHPQAGMCTIDVEGLESTEGRSDAVIAQDLAAQLRRLADQGITQINGIFYVSNACERKSQGRNHLLLLMGMFGPDALQSVAHVVNEPASCRGRGDSLRAHFASAVKYPPVNFNTRSIVVDLKEPYVRNNSQLDLVRAQLRSFDVVQTLDEVIAHLQNMYQRLRNDPAVWETYTEYEVRTEIVDEDVKTIIDEPYTYNCNSRRICKTRICGVCVDHRTVHETCAGTRPKEVTLRKPTPKVHRTPVEKTRLLFGEAELMARVRAAHMDALRAELGGFTETQQGAGHTEP